jgi:hypothetical protein
MGNKVAAIDSTGGNNYSKKGHDYDPYLRAFLEGVPEGAIESTWEDEENSDSILVIRGLGGGSQKAIKSCWNSRREFYAVDTGYFGNNIKHKRWHRITKNAVQNMGPIVNRPFDRLEMVKYKYKPFTEGRKILICPPSDKVMKLFGQGTAQEWTDNIVKEIKTLTDRPIEIRMKPIRSERVTTNTIQDALADDVHCLVTYNSIAATEALMEGKPAITLGPNAAQLICETDLNKIENPKIPTYDEMMAFMAHLSYAQFTELEMRNGYAWKILNEGGSE